MSLPVLILLVGLLGLGLLVGSGWWIASHRQTLPWPGWLKWMAEIEDPFAGANRIGIILDHLELQRGMKVLDIGSGPGRLTIPIARRVGPEGAVAAVDIQPKALKRVERRARRARLQNVRVVEATIGEGVLRAKGEADRALLVTVLGDIENQETALREIYDLLKRGGLLVITEDVINSSEFEDRDDVLLLASEAGFEALGFYGNRFAFTFVFQKPLAPPVYVP